MLHIEYSLQMMTPTGWGTCSVLIVQRRWSICSSVRHQTSSHHHFGLQIVQTSTQSIIKYRMFFSSEFTAGKIQTVDKLRQHIIEK